MTSVAMMDEDVVDFLEELHKYSGFELCVLRRSTTGRGWRLHSASADELKQLGEVGSRSVTEAVARAKRNGLLS